jgi:hypothetical protein
MKATYKGLLLALLHVALVCTLGAKLLHDRGHRPRVWIKTAPRDPNLPIRGRYLSLSLEVPAEGFSLRTQPSPWQKDKDGNPVLEEIVMPQSCDLVLHGGELIAVANQNGKFWGVRIRHNGDNLMAIVPTQTAYFIPEHIPDPSSRHADEELWIEATIPRKGPPRPIRLGVKKNGVLTPLATPPHPCPWFAL